MGSDRATIVDAIRGQSLFPHPKDMPQQRRVRHDGKYLAKHHRLLGLLDGPELHYVGGLHAVAEQ